MQHVIGIKFLADPLKYFTVILSENRHIYRFHAYKAQKWLLPVSLDGSEPEFAG